MVRIFFFSQSQTLIIENMNSLNDSSYINNKYTTNTNIAYGCNNNNNVSGINVLLDAWSNGLDKGDWSNALKEF